VSRPVRFVTLASLASVGLLVASVSCATFDFPNRACRGADVVAQPSMTPSCASCIESRCCDPVGRCEDDGTSCVNPVRDMFDCVLKNGMTSTAESQCVNALSGVAHAKDAYVCMRDQCGSACKLPSCRVDTAANLIGSAQCDSCFTGACCAELNACYGNRACKLITDCITERCADSLGLGLQLAEQAGLGDYEAGTDPSCTQNAPPTKELAVGPVKCVFDCIGEFGPLDQAGQFDPASGAYCLSTKLFACGTRAGCGAKCAIAGGDAAAPVDADAPDAPDAGDAD
jgi:hypothetical protein